MPFRNRITENIVLPLSDSFSGQSVYKCLNFLLKSQYWTKSELENYQNEYLKKIIHHAYNNVPYYNELFKNLKLKPNDINTVSDLNKIPILTKDTIRKNLANKKLVATNLSSKELKKVGSSGSTGEPLHFFTTKYAYSINIASALRGWYWMGYRLGDKYIKLSQNPRNSRIKRLQDKLSNNKYLYSQQLTDENFSSLIKEISIYKPKVLRGYPDPLFYLSKFVKRNAITNVQIPLIATTGNVLFPETRKFIENQFGAKIFDSYSCEGSTVFCEASNHRYYYGAMELAITEILSDNKFVNYGERGRHISTDLHNYATPFIRYDTQDYITYADKTIQEKKDLNLIAIQKIDGRDSDILITPNGKYLIVHNFTGFFQNPKLNSVEQFQVIQDKIDEITIKIATNEDFNKELYNYILNYWVNYIGDNVNIKIETVNKILPSKSGKRRFLIRNKDIKLTD